MLKLTPDIKSSLSSLCQSHRVEQLYLFGSGIREDYKESESDLDFVVEFSKDIEVLDFGKNYFSFQFALEDLFQTKIDLVCTNELKNPILIKEIDKSKIELYAA